MPKQRLRRVRSVAMISGSDLLSRAREAATYLRVWENVVLGPTFLVRVFT